MSQLKSRAAVLTKSEAGLTILFRLRFCFDFLPPDHHGHGSHGHGGHGRGRGLSHRAEGNSNRDWNSISRPRRIETEPIKNLLKLDSSFWINLSQNHRDRSIQIERACQLHDTKMAQHGLQLKGFNISCLSWALVYLKFWGLSRDATNLGYADVKLDFARMATQLGYFFPSKCVTIEWQVYQFLPNTLHPRGKN